MIRELRGVKLFAFDLDGTVYVGDHQVSGANELIEYLRKNYDVAFITNNSTKTVHQIHGKLNNVGISCNPDEVYTASSAMASYLKEFDINRVFVIGTQGLRDEIERQGIRVAERDVAEHLVVGLDFGITYEKIADALAIVRKGGKFIACNEDMSFPVGENMVLPGCGAMVGAIEASSGRRPDYVVGKPNTYLLSKIAEKYKVKPHEVVIVGDSYESDVRMALRYGSKAILVGDDACVAEPSVIKYPNLLQFSACARASKINTLI